MSTATQDNLAFITGLGKATPMRRASQPEVIAEVIAFAPARPPRRTPGAVQTGLSSRRAPPLG
jgi:hypothetical protein